MSSKCLHFLAATTALVVLAVPAAHAGIVTADLGITKTDGAASSIPGTTVVYTITVSNAGPGDVVDASVTDAFPAALSGCTWTCSASAGSACTAGGSGNIGDSVDLLSGGTATYSVTCDVDPAATGNLDNTATVSSNAVDPTPANDSATDSNTLDPSSDLSVSMVANPTDPGAGEAMTMTVTVLNNGPSDATNVTVMTSLPGGMTLDSTAGCAEDPSGVPTCSLATIVAGGMTSFDINAFAPATAGPASMQVVVSSDSSDPVAVNNDATVEIDVEGIPAVEIPTASTVGLALLALLLFGAAFLQLRRRQVG